MGIERHEKALRLSTEDDLDPLGALFVVQQADLLADQPRWRFIEPAGNRDAAILVNPAPDFLAEMIIEILWRLADQLQMRAEALQRRLPG